MGLKSWIINKLERDVEYPAGHIELEDLAEEDREKLFKQFGEGDDNLTKFLKSAYKAGLPSIFCCSGHGTRSAYVELKITDENIEIAKKVGKILSKQGVSTNFIDDYIRGKYVDYRSMKSISTEWLNTATQILEKPELFADVEPDIYYHEQMMTSRKPFLFDTKRRLLAYLRGRKELPESSSQGTSDRSQLHENVDTRDCKEFRKSLALEENISRKILLDKDEDEEPKVSRRSKGLEL